MVWGFESKRSKLAQNEVFQVLGANVSNFLVFLHGATVALKKNCVKSFFGKNFVLKFFSVKGTEMDPKQGFSSFEKNQWVELFWLFAWSFSSTKPWKGRDRKKGKKRFLHKKGPKMSREFYNKFMHWLFPIFYMKLEQVTKSLIQTSCFGFLVQKTPKVGLK